MRSLALLASSLGSLGSIAILGLLIAGCRPSPEQKELQRARLEGRSLYLTNCAACHGEDANGRGPQRETLDPPPRDYTDPDWLASTNREEVYAAIAEGVADSAMPSWSFNFTEQEIWDLTTYVLSVAEHGAQVERRTQ